MGFAFSKVAGLKFHHSSFPGNCLKSPMNHCVKSVRIQSFSGPCYPAFGLNEKRDTETKRDSIFPYSVQIRENTDQKNSKCGHFSSSEHLRTFTLNTFSFEQIIELIY